MVWWNVPQWNFQFPNLIFTVLYVMSQGSYNWTWWKYLHEPFTLMGFTFSESGLQWLEQVSWIFFSTLLYGKGQFIHSFFNGYLDCFLFLTDTNKTTMCMSFVGQVLSFLLGYIIFIVAWGKAGRPFSPNSHVLTTWKLSETCPWALPSSHWLPTPLLRLLPKCFPQVVPY